MILTGARPARATDYTITVNAGTQTSGNPRFWSATVGTGTASLTLRPDLQTHYKLANRELGMQRVRGHGVLNDDMGIFHWTGTGAPTYTWTNFDKYLAAIVAAGMRPFVELSFMPADLSSGDSKSKPKDMTVYKQFIQAVVQHCVDKYGAADVGQWYWEVWNEPDYPGFWNHTLTDYYALYDAAVDGATAVLPNILIGGPSTTDAGPTKIGAFLQHTKAANKRVAFVSSHVYPGGDGTGAPNATLLVNDNNTRVSQITSNGYTTAQVKSINTEWNSAYAGQGGKPGDANLSMDNHWNAGFILKGVKLMADKNVGDTAAIETFSYWAVSDVFDESTGPSGSYILAQGGNLPFGRVFGLINFQGMRKAAWNAFKMLNYLGTKRVMSSGGTASDGVDGMATLSASGDELQILVYNYYATLNTTGTDNVTVNISNLPAALANKELFVTHFRVDETHSNPYRVWTSQGSPTNPTEAQWQAMRAEQHLALLTPVGKAAVTTTYTSTFALPRQGASLVILGVKRPVTGRNAFVEIEGEDYDGQSGVTKEDSADTTTYGQSIKGAAGNYVFYRNVDLSDAGASGVQLRVNAAAATTLELRADSQTGTLLGTCQVAATAGAWATQTCAITPTTGVKLLYVVFGGAVRLNSLKFTGAGTTTGTGGTGGGTGGAGGGAGGRGGSGASGGSAGGTSAGVAGSTGTGSGGSGNGGSGTGVGGSSGDAGSGGSVTGAAGSGVTGGGGSGSGVAGGSATGNAGSGTTGVAGTSGSGGSGGPPGGTDGGGCGCDVGNAGGSSGMLLMVGLAAAASGMRRKRARRTS